MWKDDYDACEHTTDTLIYYYQHASLPVKGGNNMIYRNWIWLNTDSGRTMIDVNCVIGVSMNEYTDIHMTSGTIFTVRDGSASDLVDMLEIMYSEEE
tara:strand:- start:37 stop:327 length:291 start_codon:yes stop_codon:yes gene_type:complete